MELSAQELRIGNLVRQKFLKNTDIILGIKKNYLITSCKIAKNDWVADILYEPIPLSEVLLLKVGFKSISDIHPTFRCGRIIVEENILKDGYTIRIAINNQESIQVIKLKHLHQLQNLYFALTGKELNTSGL